MGILLLSDLLGMRSSCGGSGSSGGGGGSSGGGGGESSVGGGGRHEGGVEVMLSLDFSDHVHSEIRLFFGCLLCVTTSAVLFV